MTIYIFLLDRKKHGRAATLTSVDGGDAPVGRDACASKKKHGPAEIVRNQNTISGSPQEKTWACGDSNSGPPPFSNPFSCGFEQASASETHNPITTKTLKFFGPKKLCFLWNPDKGFVKATS